MLLAWSWLVDCILVGGSFTRCQYMLRSRNFSDWEVNIYNNYYFAKISADAISALIYFVFVNSASDANIYQICNLAEFIFFVRKTWNGFSRPLMIFKIIFWKYRLELNWIICNQHKKKFSCLLMESMKISSDESLCSIKIYSIKLGEEGEARYHWIQKLTHSWILDVTEMFINVCQCRFSMSRQILWNLWEFSPSLSWTVMKAKFI